ncbi:MAG: ACP phosphodiesterase [Oceanisphaera sp.]|uniref:acyl carrier protein phosphodiesterase n=1 Tax=Oceanisphaera sp. TaxID=1929979 RepID=UPI003F97D611
MNYLAHLHLAQLSQTSLPGSLLGEYVKGDISSSTSLPADLELGVWLHRRIDSFTDAHPQHLGAVRALPSPYRRFGGIIMDMMFDHFLAKHWGCFSAEPLSDFIDQAHALLIPDKHWPAAMETLVSRMQQYQLLASYQSLEGISVALARIDQRFRRPTPLPHCAPILQAHYPQMEQAFMRFYPELMDYVLSLTENKRPES